MPKIAMDYSKTIIYKIVCNNLMITECYVGHTTNFIKRRNSHKSQCNNKNSNCYDYKVYQFIRNNGGWDNWSMIEIEKYSCNDVNEAVARERYWIEYLKSNLNYNIPLRTCADREILNKEKLQEYRANYRIENKNKINENQKQKFSCECGGRYIYSNKIQHLKTEKHKNFILASAF